MKTVNFPKMTDSDLIAYFSRNRLLTTSTSANAKIAKSNKSSEDFRTAYVALLPGKMSGYSMCPNSEHCIDDCIAHSSGRNTDPKNIIAKYLKTIFWRRLPDLFKSQLLHEVDNFSILCQKQEKTAAARLNAYSDVVWETQFPELFHVPHTVFYDYTKLYRRFDKGLPANYFLTHSLIAADNPDISELCRLQRQFSAVVSRDIFDSITWQYNSLWDCETKNVWIDGRFVQLINGDNDDLTFRKPAGILLLREKYLVKPEKPNPLVFTDRSIFGL